MAPPITAAGPVKVAGPAVDSAPIPTKAIDVSTIDLKSVEFKQLPATYQRAVKDAKAYAEKNFKTMAPPPRVLVTPSSAKTNGGLPVTMVIPPGAKEPLSVQTHYHGDNAHAVSGENAAADTIARQVKAGDQTVYVLPEAQKAGGAGTDWNNTGNIGGTTDEALAHAGLSEKAAKRTISAHSGGGRAINKAVANGEQLKADHLVIQDALYDPAATNMGKTLPAASAGVKRITIQPTVETPHDARTETLRKLLADAGRNVDVAPKTAKHAQAAGQLRPPPPGVKPSADRFD